MGMKGPGNNNNGYLDVIHFELRPEETQRLIESGQNAVLNYFRNRNLLEAREDVRNQDQQGNARPEADPDNDDERNRNHQTVVHPKR